MDELAVLDNIFYSYCTSVYSCLSGYTRGYRDMLREKGLGDEEIKRRINRITSNAIDINKRVTELIEKEVRSNGE